MGKRIVKRRTPGGRITILIKKKKGKPARCAICGKPLQGVVRDHPRNLKKYPKSQKTVSRPYGGYLCHECLEKQIKAKIRSTIIQ